VQEKEAAGLEDSEIAPSSDMLASQHASLKAGHTVAFCSLLSAQRHDLCTFPLFFLHGCTARLEAVEEAWGLGGIHTLEGGTMRKITLKRALPPAFLCLLHHHHTPL